MSTGSSNGLRLLTDLFNATSSRPNKGKLQQESTGTTQNDQTSKKSGFWFPFQADLKYMTSRSMSAGMMVFVEGVHGRNLSRETEYVKRRNELSRLCADAQLTLESTLTIAL